MGLEQYSKWLGIVVDTYLSSPSLLLSIDLLDLHRIAEGNEQLLNPSDICWSIYYSMLYIDDYLPYNYMHLYQLYDEFMVSHGWEKIEEITIPEEEFARKRSIHLLKHVCVEKVIDNSVKFGSTEDLESELISKYQLLQNIDPQNIESYSGDIRRITQRAMIRKSIQRIDQSRIFIDITNVKESIDVAFKDNYRRYSEYLGLHDTFRKLLRVTKEYRISIILNLSKSLDMTQYEDAAFYLFRGLFDEIRKSYAVNLDSYLSTRIRHGTLAGQIRSAFETERLITAKDKTGIYEHNQYWLTKLAGEGEHSVQRIDESLNQFSREIDTLIEKIRGDWIQIRSNEKPDGLFDYSFSDEELSTEYDALSTECMEPDVFFDKVIEILKKRTIDCLNGIRQEIKNKIRPAITDCIDKLRVKIDSCAKGQKKTQIIDAIARCGTNVPNCLDIVEGWFDGIGEHEAPNFTLPHLLDTVAAIINNCFQGSRFEPKRDMLYDVESQLKGLYFNALVDVFFTVCENIVKHAKTSLDSIVIVIRRSDSSLHIAVTNPIPDDVNMDELHERIGDISKKLASGDIADLIRVEGGSGLYKIHRILQSDLHMNPEDHYGFEVENGSFKVWIKLDLKEIEA